MLCFIRRPVAFDDRTGDLTVFVENKGQTVAARIGRTTLEFTTRATVDGKDASLLALVQNKRRLLRAIDKALARRGAEAGEVQVLTTDLFAPSRFAPSQDSQSAARLDVISSRDRQGKPRAWR
jgi:hypothetical protein